MKGFQSNYFLNIDYNESPYLRNYSKPSRSILFAVAGGLGDRILMHPIINYFSKNYPHEITVVSNVSFLYNNIPKIKNLTPQDDYDYTKHHVYTPYMPKDYLMYQIVNANNINYFDYISINTIQSTLPTPEDKLIRIPLCDQYITDKVFDTIKPILDYYLLFHFSDSEPARKVPSEYVNNLLNTLNKNLFIPIIIVGKSNNELGRSTLDFNIPDSPNVINLIDKTTIEEAIFLAQKAKIVVTSDSYPLHAASSVNSSAHIFYYSYFKNNQYLAHYRLNEGGQVEFGWRTKNLILNPDVNIFLDPEFRFYADEDKLNQKILEAQKKLPSVEKVIEVIKTVI